MKPPGEIKGVLEEPPEKERGPYEFGGGERPSRPGVSPVACQGLSRTTMDQPCACPVRNHRKS